MCPRSKRRLWELPAQNTGLSHPESGARLTPDHGPISPPITGPSHPRSRAHLTPDHGPISPPITGLSHPLSGVTYSQVPRIVRAPWTTHPSSHYSHSCLQGAPEQDLSEQPVPLSRESLTHLTCACQAVRVSLLSGEQWGWTKTSLQPSSENYCGPITAPSAPDRTPLCGNVETGAVVG